MKKPKFDWDTIIKDSAEVIAHSLKVGKEITAIKSLYDELKKIYLSGNKDIPEFNTYRQVIRKKLNIAPKKKNVKTELYQLAGAYAKMSFKMLTENTTISSCAIADSGCWLFIRLKNIDSDYNNTAKHMYTLAHELKKKFIGKIVFVSFDNDTVVIMCSDNMARQEILQYFQSPKIKADIIV